MNIEDVYKKLNPLDFWFGHQRKFPGRSLLARHLFSIRTSSVGIERQFTSAGLTINQRRSTLAPETVDDILFVRSIQKILGSIPDFSNI